MLYSAVAEAGKLLAPPYDVLSPADRAEYAALSAKNIVHLILPEGDSDDRYKQAATRWGAWRKDGTVVRDDRPALYRYHQTFTAEGREHTRKGFIALLRLERFGEGQVMPHERTLAGPKVDRLKLMRACRAHFSQIFLLYSDPQRRTDAAFAADESLSPHIDARSRDGVRQRLWRTQDPAAIKKVIDHLRAERVYIADGHHRYETMIALRDELSAQLPGPASHARSAVRYGCVFLSNMDDPELLVLPTHRAVHSVAGFDGGTLLDRAREHFVVEARPWANAETVRGILAEKGSRGPTFALAMPGRSAIEYLTLRDDVAAPIPGADVVKRMDVTVLHALILERILGITREAQEKQTNLRYIKDTAQALEAARTGESGTQAVIVMNPTKVAEVKAVADAGEIMPQKSTYFVPKLASGIVMNVIDPEETIPEL
jgi:uncharacterized protein (DUF1015 family)